MYLAKFGRAALLLALFVLSATLAAEPRKQEYRSTCSGTLTSQSTKCTLQLAAGASRWALPSKVFIQCLTGSCSITQERDGTAATVSGASAEATVNKRNPNASWVTSNVAKVYSDSNVGSGTATGTPFTLPAGQSVTLDAEGTILEKGSQAVQNYTIAIGTTTATYTITFVWEERNSY